MTRPKLQYLLLALPVTGVFGVFLWLVATHAGLLFLLSTLTSYGNLSLQFDNLQGSLTSRITVDHIRYQDESTEVSIDKFESDISLSWLLLDARLAFDETNINKLTIKLKDKKEVKKESPTLKQSLTFESPLGISLNELTINEIMVTDSDPITEIKNIVADEIKIDQELELDELQLTVANFTLKLDGTVELAEPTKTKLAVDWKIAGSENIPAVAGKSRLKGDNENLSVNTKIIKPQSLLLETKFKNILTEPRWESTLNSESINLGFIDASIQTQLEKVSAELSGDLKSASIHGTTVLVDPQYGNWQSKFNASFTEQQWQVTALRLISQQSRAKVLVQAQSKGNTPYSATTALSMTTEWSYLQWPTKGTADYYSDKGKVELSGTLKNYQIKTTGVFAFDDYRFSDIVAEGKGNTTALNLNSFTATYLEGNWQGNTSFDWSKGFQWQAALNVKDANPAVQWKQLEGRLNGSVTGKGNHQQNDWLITGDIKKLSGSFRNYPISGGSQYSVSGKEYAFTELHLRSGVNSLDGAITISDYLGDTETQIKTNWKLNAKNIAQLLPNATGSIVSNGKAFGSLQSPSIDAVASAKDFKYQNYVSARAELKAKANLQHNDKMTVNFSAKDSSVNDTTIEQLDLNISGTTQVHELRATTKLKEIDSVVLHAKGGYQNKQWDGQLTTLDINAGKFGNWKLPEPAALVASDRRMLVRNACLSQEVNAGLVCIILESDAFTRFDIGTKISKLPIGLFRNLLPERFNTINGIIDGKGQLVLDNATIHTLELSLNSEGGNLTHTLVNDKPTSIRFDKLSITAEKQKQTIKLSTNMDLQETGQTSAWLSLNKVNTIEDFKTDLPISGEISSVINDLSLLPLLIPEIQSIQGKISSQFRISGTLTNPKITGQSKLLAERITLPLAGLELKNTEINTHSTESRRVSIEGSSHSGDGMITFKGDIPDYAAENLLVKLDISGERFLAMKIPDIEMEVSPRISLILEGNSVNMEGEIFVDRAKISPVESYAGLTPSSDVVFIDPQATTTQQEPYKLLGTMRLKLSDQVFVQSSGFNGRITGELAITESTNNVTLATGELLIKDGRYTASVRSDNIPSLLISIAQKELLIDESKLIYASSPVDNPRLDIRARRPTGTDVVVGVEIKGHANDPQVALFSEPAMDQADILAYLTLGYPLSEASKNDGQYLARIASSIGLVGGEKLAKNIAKEFGIDEVYIQSQDTTQQAQLVLGKYLSPKLYIRYAVGIGEAVDTLQIQYKLTDRWILRTETDETQKGTDLIYTIDK